MPGDPGIGKKPSPLELGGTRRRAKGGDKTVSFNSVMGNSGGEGGLESGKGAEFEKQKANALFGQIGQRHYGGSCERGDSEGKQKTGGKKPKQVSESVRKARRQKEKDGEDFRRGQTAEQGAGWQ